MIGIIDIDKCGNNHTTHPNLVCMKLSSFHKQRGEDVRLISTYEEAVHCTQIFASKVFTFSQEPKWLKNLKNVTRGGTGYYYDKSPRLPDEIEHLMPDYHLYNDYVKEHVEKKGKKAHPENYQDFSIGFLTRGCFRKCDFCVNKNYDKAVLHSPLEEFHDESRPYLRFWCDNFLAVNRKDFLRIINDIRKVNKPAVWQQGLDIRLMTEEKADIMSSLKWYKKNWLFALDHVEDIPQVEQGFSNWIKYVKQNTRVRSMFGKVYVLVGFEGLGIEDVESMFKRIKFLSEHALISMPMFFNGTNYINKSEFHWLYKLVKNWTNPICFSKQSLLQYATKYRPKLIAQIDDLLLQFPHLSQYFHMRYCDLKMV